MVGIPLGGMLGQQGIWRGVQLRKKVGLLVGPDAGCTTGRTLWGQIAIGATQA
jgi:hypothetical protein